jgi:NAD-dependent dihydropyrimidine dehydrogenase PreA subunit
MGKRRCEGCGEAVTVAGGIASLWSGGTDATGGMTLELDGGDCFLCFDCVERLPDDRTITADDVQRLPPADEREESDG